MALTAEQIGNMLSAIFASSGGAADLSLIKDTYLRKWVKSDVTDGGTAATDNAEKIVFTNLTGGNLKVVGMKVTCPVAVTSSDTTNKVFLLQKRPASAPGTPATVAAPDTSATGAASLGTTPLATAFTACTAPVGAFTAANTVLAPGDILTIKTTHGSTGVAVASSTIAVSIDLFLEPV